MRRPRWISALAIGSAAISLCLWVLGGVLAVRLDRRIDSLDSRFDGMSGEIEAIDRRGERSERRVAAMKERLRVIGHPLRAAVSWPVSGPLLEPYGPRGSGWHAGIDVDAPDGAPVAAAAPGVVVRAGWDGGYGNRVVVAHGRGLETTYAHLDAISVGPGTFVSDSSQVGTVGCTGSCNGAHLHFEIRVNGVSSDPLLWLPPHPSRVTALVSAG